MSKNHIQVIKTAFGKVEIETFATLYNISIYESDDDSYSLLSSTWIKQAGDKMSKQSTSWVLSAREKAEFDAITKDESVTLHQIMVAVKYYPALVQQFSDYKKEMRK
jgi:hypothetical protein